MLNRRLLMAACAAGGPPPGPDIVMDGLAFRLEGGNRGGKPRQWIDTVGGVVFDLVNCLEASDFVQFNKSAYGVSTTPRSGPKESGTFEAVFLSNDNDGILFCGSRAYSYNVGFSGNNLWASTENRFGFKVKNDRSIHTISVCVTAQTGYEDLQRLAYGSKDLWGTNADRWYIGARHLGKLKNFWNGNIYEIRYYNRKLTEEEVLQNQQHDIAVYMGGVIPE